ncbi:conserved hypothetical protein [gamma proteobacterium NOR5-3]|nr:conserved hypothetical protein [gamma proteobacterium NOR5-3]
MKQKIFKSIGIASAVAAASVGYSTVANGQVDAAPAISANGLGDLALVPYYTVEDSWTTGVHVINTSAKTQVVKFRLRRAVDSLDALDFNVILSPKDVFAGEVTDDENGDIYFATYGDTTCTAPIVADGKFKMPDLYKTGAETGYIEIIAMGQPDVAETASPIGTAAKHVGGVPRDCEAVASNFFADGAAGGAVGNVDAVTTQQMAPTKGDGVTAGAAASLNTFEASGDVLKVSYYIRDTETGIEFGDNAVHIEGFMEGPAMSNQERGIFSGDLAGFDFPDLNGGMPTSAVATAAATGAFPILRTALADGNNIINEWSTNPENGVLLNWVVTLPGQYTMLDMPQYLASLADADEDCLTVDGAAAANAANPAAPIPAVACDYRDIPVTANFLATVYDRDELGINAPDGSLVVSPSVPGATSSTLLRNEVNVVSFGGNEIFGDADADVTAPALGNFGWLSMNVASQGTAANSQGICEWDAAAPAAALTMTCTAGAPVLADQAPLIGFAAWVRSVNDNPDASYGRIIAHSKASTAAL